MLNHGGKMSEMPTSAVPTRRGEKIVNAASFTGTRLGRAATYFGADNRQFVARRVGTFLREHPGASLGVAAGLGLLIGFGTKRR
jgi:ElaB/YqjD/DUF883 family membrane-anchored ribosome-binding protein